MKRFSRSSRPTGPKMRVPRGSPSGLQDHGCVLVELDVRAVRPAPLLGCTYDHRLDDFTLLDVAARDGVLDGADDDVADARVAAPDPPSTRMHKISLAPVLSATLSRDSCWIISALSSQTCQRGWWL